MNKPDTYGAFLRNESGDTYIGPISRADLDDMRRLADARQGLPIDPHLEDDDDA